MRDNAQRCDATRVVVFGYSLSTERWKIGYAGACDIELRKFDNIITRAP